MTSSVKVKNKGNKKYIKRDAVLSTLFIVLTAAGLVCLLYPTASDVINTVNESKAIHLYQKEVDLLPTHQDELEYERAQEYNRQLAKLHSPLFESSSLEGYSDILNVNSNGIIGIVDIPKINVSLPIYHGTSDEVLGNAVGHLQGTSFPVEGDNTHSVIAAHSGVNNARLFTDIDSLDIGDTFTITVLNKELLYKVDNIEVVLPEETIALEIVDGGNYVTLQTCTPYGVNSHRLLVRGKYITTTKVEKKATEEGSWEETVVTVMSVLTTKRNITPVIIAVGLVLLFVILRIIINFKRNKRQRGEKQ